VIGGRDEYGLDDLSPDGSIHSYDKKQKGKEEAFSGIKVTTLVTQEESNIARMASHNKSESTDKLV